MSEYKLPDWCIAPRYVVNMDTVNIDDLLNARPGGIVRVYGDPHEAIMVLPDLWDSYAFVAGAVSENP